MKLSVIIVSTSLLGGCAMVAVADLAVTTVATVAKAGVQTAGDAVSAVPSDKKSEKPKEK